MRSARVTVEVIHERGEEESLRARNEERTRRAAAFEGFIRESETGDSSRDVMGGSVVGAAL
jgi:hypothetical protein